MAKDVADVERALSGIPEVRAARIVADASGTPVEVHVLATTGKPAKQIVREIQSVAMAAADLHIDHRIVSVVQLDDPTVQRAAAGSTGGDPVPAPAAAPEEHEPVRSAVAVLEHGTGNAPGAGPAGDRARRDAAAGAARIVVDRVLILRRGVTCTAEVVLRRGDELVTGEADGSAAARATLRLAAEATLDALHRLHPGTAGASIETATVADMSDRLIALTSVVLVVPPHEELVTGSAPVRGAGEHEAVARSVLDAMNRRLQEPDRPSR